MTTPSLNSERTETAKRREDKADGWGRWIRTKMADAGSSDPLELLPEICARLDQLSEFRTAAAVQKLKKSLKDALK